MTPCRRLPPHPRHLVPSACPFVSSPNSDIASISCSLSSPVPTNDLLADSQRAGDSARGTVGLGYLGGGCDLTAICCPFSHPLRYRNTRATPTISLSTEPTNDGGKS